MSGPYSPDHRLGAGGPPFTDANPSQPIPAPPSYPGPPPDPAGEAAPPSAAYPGPLPPPVRYPKRGRSRLVIGVLAALVLIVALIAAVVRGSHTDPATAAGGFSDATATTAIQGYLDALKHRDTETIARNTLCGIYDAVRDRRADQALAKLSSERVPQDVLRGAGDLDRQDRVLVELSGPGVVQHARQGCRQRSRTRKRAGNRAVTTATQPDSGVLLRAAD